MHENLKAIGVANIASIERFTLRSEADYDILKIYHKKKRGELFAKSEKFKFPRQKKRMKVDADGKSSYQNMSEISPNLRYVVAELETVCKKDNGQVDIREKILKDLRHLEKVVSHKIAEIEADLEKL